MKPAVMEKETKPKLVLPTEKTPIVAQLDLATMLLYGPEKIGKTTLAASWPKPLFIATEAGHKFQSIYKMGVGNWKEFVQISEMFREEKHSYRTMVIDTVDVLVDYCQEYVCEKRGIEHLSEEEWGRAYEAMRTELMRAIVPLTVPRRDGSTPFGLVLISHSRTAEVKGRVTKTLRIVPTLPSSGRKVILPLVDIIAYAGFEVTADGETTDRRVLRFAPSEDCEAGDRTGRMPAQAPLKKIGGYDLLKGFFEGQRMTDDNSGTAPERYRKPKKAV